MKYIKLFENFDLSNKVSLYCGHSIEYKKGKTEENKYKSSKDKMYQIASCSKFITSLVVAKLYELNKLDYDTDINTYLKKWKCKTKGITLRHLLTHTSGSSDGNGFLGMEPAVKYKQDLQLNIDIITGNSYSKPFNITETPGKKFIYSGAGFQVIQQVLEEITGERLHKLMQNYVFNPIDMKSSTARLLYDKHNYKLADMNGLYRIHPETAAAGVWMSCNDLLSLGKDLIKGYNDDESKILKQETIKMITKVEHPKWEKDDENWGLGMFVSQKYGKKLFGHNGANYAYGMDFYCIPENEEIYIRMYNYNPIYRERLNKDISKFILQPKPPGYYKNKTHE
jgi:CubicO group peptidase (beta-lactamase class C family)